MVIDLPIIIGIVGMIFVLFGFIMIQTHRWTADNLGFDLVNFLGSGMLCVYGYIGQVWPFVILNGIFALYSMKEVLTDILTSKKPR